MKKLLLASLLCLAAVMVITPAYATETWDPHLHGVDEGLAAGALPPPGVYFINDSYFAPVAPIQGPDGHQAPGVKLFAYVDVPILLWVPGCKFLGADYGVAIAEPFDYVNLMTHRLVRRLLAFKYPDRNGAHLIPFSCPTFCRGSSPVISASRPLLRLVSTMQRVLSQTPG